MRYKKYVLAAILAATAVALVPETSEAQIFGRGRGRGYYGGGGYYGNGYYGGGYGSGYYGNGWSSSYPSYSDGSIIQMSGSNDPCCCSNGGPMMQSVPMMQPGMQQPSAQYGVQPGTQYGVQPGTQYGVQPGAQPRTQGAPMPQGDPQNANPNPLPPNTSTSPGTAGQPQTNPPR